MKIIFFIRSLPIIISLLLARVDFSYAQSSYLTVEDNRDLISSPGDYKRIVKPSFKWGPVIGFSNNAYFTVLGINGWVDDSGGPAHELAFSTSNGMYYRSGTLAAGWTGWRRVLSENSSGNVGIGTDNPKAKLAVDGNILAKEIKVKTDITVPDYVFETDYELNSLDYIADYVKTNKHLPEIPSAKEIKKDGLDLAEMNLLLLKKVEELTLYAIQQDKEIRSQNLKSAEQKNLLEEQRKEIADMKRIGKLLEQRLNQLESKK